MSIFPLHVQRKLEQRWAAKFASPVASAARKSTSLKGTGNQLSEPAKAKRKTRRVEAAGLKSAPAV